MKWIKNKDEFPKEPHFVIFEFSSYYVEESNGWSGHSESKCEYIVFDSEEDWKNEISKRSGLVYGNQKWAAAKVIPAIIRTAITVTIE